MAIMLLAVGTVIPFQPTSVPSERRTTVPPPAASATTLVALAGGFVAPVPHSTTVPSVRAAKLAPKLPATAKALVRFGGGRHSLLVLRPQAATLPKVRSASALVATLT